MRLNLDAFKAQRSRFAGGERSHREWEAVELFELLFSESWNSLGGDKALSRHENAGGLF